MELKRRYEAGAIGQVTYAEGEYNHPMDPFNRMRIMPGRDHWRALIPPTYYNTHALAPLMYITGTLPVSVNALAIKRDALHEGTFHDGDAGGVILCRMDNGAVFRIFGLFIAGHSVYYRLHGERGAMETTDKNAYWNSEVRIWRDEWLLREGEAAHEQYMPAWQGSAELAEAAGHGGGDFWTEHYFSRAIRTGEQPFLDVYRGVAMSNVGILAWRSALRGGAPVEAPDFRDESVRKLYENDNACPFPDVEGGDLIPRFTGAGRDLSLDKQAVENAKKAWSEMGYTEKEIEEMLEQKG